MIMTLPGYLLKCFVLMPILLIIIQQQNQILYSFVDLPLGVNGKLCFVIVAIPGYLNNLMKFTCSMFHFFIL